MKLEVIAAHKTGSSKNQYMTDFTVVSRRQVELAIEIRAYRNRHGISMLQTAKIASAYGDPYKVKFSATEISKYERFITIPSEKKMNALLNMIGLEIEDLD